MDHSADDLVHAASPCGGLTVTTTPDGIPVSVRIGRAQLSVTPERLAARIVALCAVARAGADHRHRLHLIERGTPAETLDALGLASRRRVVELEESAAALWGVRR
ncbi:MAG: hypothetical protein QM774_14135 [Gordonia sp. (in: high G+C Gram-positive bacteria)]|uniref:hypothetical protein n=1 Tax=Gordonia sp. (in: high G+C Gram-positive bacteria) TaxID=84139 RepID=UPI0039E49F33